MKLQARFRNDQRFKLDKRFLESDSDEESQGECFILKIFNCLKIELTYLTVGRQHVDFKFVKPMASLPTSVSLDGNHVQSLIKPG